MKRAPLARAREEREKKGGNSSLVLLLLLMLLLVPFAPAPPPGITSVGSKAYGIESLATTVSSEMTTTDPLTPPPSTGGTHSVSVLAATNVVSTI